MATSNRIETIFTAQDRASAVMRQIGAAGDKLQGTFDRIQAPLLRAQTLWAGLAGGAIVGGIRALVGAIDDLDEAAQALGTTAVQLAQLRQAGAEAGLGVEKLDTALTRLNVNISEAAAGNPKAAAAFRAFRSEALNAAVAAGDSGKVLRALADEFVKLQDGPAKASLAVDLFGKAGAALVPLLNGGSAALERYTGLTEETVKESAKLQKEIDKLTATWEKFKFSVASFVIPKINAIFDPGSIAQQIAETETIIKSMEFSGVGDPKNLEMYRAQLARLKNELAASTAAESEHSQAAKGSAQAVRDRAAADEAAAAAAGKKTKAIRESSNAYRQEFDDVARIRRNRAAGEEDIRREEEAAAERRRQRADQLTGRSDFRQQQEDLAILREEFEAGNIEAIEFEIRKAKIFGRGNEIEQGMERQIDLAEQLGLTLSSSLGDLITSGGKASDIFKALGQDIAKMVLQLTVLNPLAKELKKAFEGLGSGGGGGGADFFSQLISGAGSFIAGLGGGGGTATAGAGGFTGMDSYATGWAGAASVNVYIDGATDRARISSLVSQGVKAGIAASVDNTARGGSGVVG